MLDEAGQQRRMYRTVITLAVSTLLAQPVSAEPGPKVNQLMDTPTSLFSFGLYQLREYVVQQFGSFRGRQYQIPLSGLMAFTTAVYYEWDTNRIVVSLGNFDKKPDNWDHEEDCKQAIAAVRGAAFIDIKTGEPFSGSNSYFSSFFLPIGFSLKAIPEDTAASLDEIIQIEVQTALPSDGGASCNAPLVGTSYSVER